MKRWGLVMMAMGGLSVVLPIVGMQFRIFALFGEAEGTVAVLSIGAGFVLWLLGLVMGEPASEEEVEETPEGPVAQPVDERISVGDGRTCPHCRAVLEPTDEFCGDCGGALGEQPFIAAQTVASGTPHSPPPSKTGFGKKAFLAVVGVVAAYGAFQAFRPGEGGQSAPAEPEPAAPARSEQAATGFPVPTDMEIVEVSALMDQANRERNEARLAGDRETEGRKAQEYQHCKTAMTHALNMREAIAEMRAAEEAGDLLTANSKPHSYRHYQGQLYLMLPYVHEPLARLIRRWTGE